MSDLERTFREEHGRVLAALLGRGRGPGRRPDPVDRLGLDGFRYFHATRGELLLRLGRSGEACEALGRALALTRDDAERRLLERRLALAGRAGPV